MKNTKIIQLLNSLSKEEMKNFGKFVSSPYHNNRKELIRFFEILKEYIPLNNNNPLDKKAIFKKLYPNAKYASAVIDKLCSFLFNIGRDFYVIENTLKNRFDYTFRLLKEMDFHKLDNLFNKEFTLAENVINNKKFNEDFFYNLFMLEKIKTDFHLHKNEQNIICGNVIKRSELWIYEFIRVLADNYQDMVFNKTSFNHDYADSVTDIFIKCLDIDSLINHNPVRENKYFRHIGYHYYRIMCYKYPDDYNNYIKFKEYSFMDFENFDNEEKTNRFNNINGYCVYQAMRGNRKFVKESFMNYKEALEKNFIDYLVNNEFVFVGYFRNFALICLTFREYDYLEKFVSEYSKFLPDEMKDDVLRMVNAQLCIVRKDFNRALDLLSKPISSFPIYKVDLKMLYVKIYYEMKDYNSLYSFLDTFKHYVNRDDYFDIYKKSSFLNYLNYVGRLAKIRETGNFDALFDLKKELAENPEENSYKYIWILEKIEELEK